MSWLNRAISAVLTAAGIWILVRSLGTLPMIGVVLIVLGALSFHLGYRRALLGKSE